MLYAVGDDHVRKEVLDAHDAAVAAAFGWIEDHAHCRYRVNGEIWAVDAEGIIAAAFRQHTSRAHDPQIHTHLVIPNRVMSPDGRWLALDARTLKHDQRTVSALYAAGLRAELTARLGVRWKPVENGLAEMVDAPKEVLEEFSKRTEQMKRRYDDKVERFVDTMGRRPTPREDWALEREAAYDSRPGKTSADALELHEHWHDQLVDLGYSPDEYVDLVTGRTRPLEADDDIDRAAVIDALSSLRDRQSVWRPAEITREIAAVLPTELGSTAAELVARADRLASHAVDTLVVDVSRPVPDGVPLRRDGRPVTEGALDRLLTTSAILDEEERILEITQRWSDQGGLDAQDIPADKDLTAIQHHAAGAVAGKRRLVLVVGPAGTGKTTAMRPAVARLHADGRPCFGVAPSAAAAEVLAVDTGIDADTLDKLLVEHRLDRPPQHRYDLPPGSTVVVDEAAMVPTPRLAEMIELAERRGWRLALIGDPLTEPELRALVKQASAHQAAADRLRLRQDEHGRSLAALARRKRALPDLVDEAKARLAHATRTLEQHDRPLRRRGHTVEIASARKEARSLPGRIEDLERELNELPTKIETERAARDQAAEQHADRHGADAERVRQALDDDARIRGEHSAEHPSPMLTEHLGPVPDEPAARERWVTAAGRIAQHRALWDLPETTLVGPLPPIGQPDYEVTYYAANRAIADLGEAVDLPRSIPSRDGPGLSL